MAKAKTPVVSVITPKGTLYYPWLRTPDTRFSADGVYKCGVVLAFKDATKIMADLQAQVEASYQIALDAAKPQDKAKIQKAQPWKEEYDAAGNDTGNIIINAKSQYPPAVYDSKNNVLPKEISPYGGSTGRMEMHIKPYFTASTKTAGISMYLQSVQIVNLVTSSGAGSAPKFDIEEDGYEAPRVLQTTQEWTEDDDEDLPFTK